MFKFVYTFVKETKIPSCLSHVPDLTGKINACEWKVKDEMRTNKFEHKRMIPVIFIDT